MAQVIFHGLFSNKICSKIDLMLWVFAVLFLVFVVLLTLPFRVEIDTTREIFEAKWLGIFGIRAVPEAEKWRLFFRIFFFEKEWFPEKGSPKKGRREPSKKSASKKKKPPFSLRQMWQLAKNMFRAVQVKHLKINWDTDDFVQNAWLFPLFQFMSRGNRQLSINFLGRQELAILLQTRLGLLAWAFLQTFFHTKFLKK